MTSRAGRDRTTHHLDERATATQQHTVWLAIRVHTMDGPHPLAVAQLAATTGLDRDTVRAALRALRMRGLLHIERRRTATGEPAPSRYLCTAPRRPDDRNPDVDRLMRERPRGR